jgi:hypothetical protein
MSQQYVNKVWIDDKRIYVSTKQGLVADYPFDRWPKLAKASPSERADFYLSYGGIHWPSLDEDLSFEAMFCSKGLCAATPTEDSVCWLQ